MEKIFLQILFGGWMMLLGAILALMAVGQFESGSAILVFTFALWGAFLTALEINDLGGENV